MSGPGVRAPKAPCTREPTQSISRYYGVPSNYRALSQFRRQVEWLWHRSLQRRSQRGRWSRSRWQAFEQRFPLPTPRIHHPWPDQRFGLR